MKALCCTAVTRSAHVPELAGWGWWSASKQRSYSLANRPGTQDSSSKCGFEIPQTKDFTAKEPDFLSEYSYQSGVTCQLLPARASFSWNFRKSKSRPQKPEGVAALGEILGQRWGTANAPQNSRPLSIPAISVSYQLDWDGFLFVVLAALGCSLRRQDAVLRLQGSLLLGSSPKWSLQGGEITQLPIKGGI